MPSTLFHGSVLDVGAEAGGMSVHMDVWLRVDGAGFIDYLGGEKPHTHVDDDDLSNNLRTGEHADAEEDIDGVLTFEKHPIKLTVTKHIDEFVNVDSASNLPRDSQSAKPNSRMSKSPEVTPL